MLAIDTTPALLNLERAERVAKDLQQGDTNWTYLLEHDKTFNNLYLVAIYDEVGEFVSYFTGRG